MWIGQLEALKSLEDGNEEPYGPLQSGERSLLAEKECPLQLEHNDFGFRK